MAIAVHVTPFGVDQRVGCSRERHHVAGLNEQVAQAEGYAQALETVFVAASQVDAKTMTIQVIEGLKAIGAGPSSTLVIPMEFTRLLGQIGDYLDQSTSSIASANGRPKGDERRLVPVPEPTEPVR